jgi:hypothetical protein
MALLASVREYAALYIVFLSDIDALTVSHWNGMA